MQKQWRGLRVSHRTYVLYAVLHILRENERSAPRSWTPLRSLKQMVGRSMSWLEKAVMPLVQAQVLVGKRGPEGGYMLGERAHELTILELVQLCEQCEPRGNDALECMLIKQMRDARVFQRRPLH